MQLVTIVGNTVEYVSNFDHSITDITAKTNVGSLQWRVTGTDTYNELEIYAKQLATSTNIGDVNAPVYFKNGVPTVCDVDLSPITGDMIREITCNGKYASLYKDNDSSDFAVKTRYVLLDLEDNKHFDRNIDSPNL